MFDKHWNIIIAVLVFVLVISYFCNNYEGFAGTVDAKNAEALALVSSVYNKDNMTVTSLNISGGSGALNAKDDITVRTKDGFGLRIGGMYTGGGIAPLTSGKPLELLAPGSVVSVGAPGATAQDLSVSGAIKGPTIDRLHNRITTLESRLANNEVKIGNATLKAVGEQLEISGVSSVGINGVFVTKKGAQSTYLAIDNNNHPYYISGPVAGGGAPVVNW
jgi:hypothetical protein